MYAYRVNDKSLPRANRKYVESLSLRTHQLILAFVQLSISFSLLSDPVRSLEPAGQQSRYRNTYWNTYKQVPLHTSDRHYTSHWTLLLLDTEAESFIN